MKTLLYPGLMLGLLVIGTAQAQMIGLDWKSAPPEAVVVTLDGARVLKIENTNHAPLTVRLMTLTNPPVTETMYSVAGEVKYEGVQGAGYLEMWSCFPPQKPSGAEDKYFSRTLADSGEMGKISGSSDWRKFLLPFDRTGASNAPTRLEINLVLPDSGTVYVRAAKARALVRYWWSSPGQVGMIGGIGGGIAGCLGALIGILSGLGRARRLVLALAVSLCGLGVVSLIAGLVAVTQHQPYMVYYPLLLGGVILSAVCGFNLPVLKKRYDDLEMRRMASADALRM
jgi:hypothetical protein